MHRVGFDRKRVSGGSDRDEPGIRDKDKRGETGSIANRFLSHAMPVRLDSVRFGMRGKRSG